MRHGIPTGCRRCLLIAGLLAVAGAVGSPVAAQTIQVRQIGFDGVAKLGYWIPVEVSISAGSTPILAKLEFECPDGEGLRVRYGMRNGAERIELAAGASVQRTVLAKIGRTASLIAARLVDAESGRLLAEHRLQPALLPASVELYLQLGPDVGIEGIEDYGPRESSRRIATHRPRNLETLPDHWLGYESVRAIVLTTSDMSWYSGLSATQRAALREWVRRGGQVLISSGQSAARLFGDDGLLSHWAPGPVAGLRNSLETTGLMNFSQAAQPLAPRIRAPFAEFDAVQGRVIAFEGGGGLGDRPLLMERAYGLGRVTVLAADIDRPPLREWLGLPRLLARMLGIVADERGTTRGQTGQGVGTAEYRDISGQLRGALDQFSNVVLVHFSWIAALIVAYMVIIGPADFFGLNALRRAHLTWLTFPLIVLGFAALAILLSRGFKGEQTRINQVQVVDCDTVSGTVRGTIWAHLYSPELTRWDLELDGARAMRDAVQVREQLLCWQGLPGTRIGGMRGPAGMAVRADPYSVTVAGDRAEISALPATVASTKSLIGRWYGDLPADWQGAAQLEVTKSGLLSGEFRNPLPVRLKRVAILYGGWMYRLPYNLEPGQMVRMRELAPLDFTWQLTRRRVVKSQDISLPWDPRDVDDLPRIVEMMMFYGEAGGENYTRLSHSYQSFIDLSSHLYLQRAILIGQPATEMGQIKVGGGRPPAIDKQVQYVRIIWPVSPASEEDRD